MQTRPDRSAKAVLMRTGGTNCSKLGDFCRGQTISALQLLAQSRDWGGAEAGHGTRSKASFSARVSE